MARTIERYTEEELAALLLLVKENASAAEPLSVADLAEHAERRMPGRTADALKQRIFKIQREAATIRPRNVSVKKLAKAAAKAGQVSNVPKSPSRKAKPVRRTRVAEAAPQEKPHTKPAALASSLNDGLLLTLPNGATVSGRAAQIAEFARQL
jgi:hypothetical protein